MTRTITIRLTWKSEHHVEVSDTTPRKAIDDLTAILEYDDLTSSSTAELTDWEIIDR